jgi:murein DD-endopeptidase MepM/ murein hydrolase activator NlpD
VVTQNAAEHLSSEGARAIDIAKGGTSNPVVAAAAGIVMTASVGGNAQCYSDNHASNGLGNYVVIRHSDSSGTTYTTYGYLNSESVTAGQPVSQGQQIGRMGYTGCVIPAGPGG